MKQNSSINVFWQLRPLPSVPGDRFNRAPVWGLVLTQQTGTMERAPRLCPRADIGPCRRYHLAAATEQD